MSHGTAAHFCPPAGSVPGQWQSWTCRAVIQFQWSLSFPQETCSLQSKGVLSSSVFYFEVHLQMKPQETPAKLRLPPQKGQKTLEGNARSFGWPPSPLPDVTLPGSASTREEDALWSGCHWKQRLKALVCSKPHRMAHWWQDGTCRRRKAPPETYGCSWSQKGKQGKAPATRGSDSHGVSNPLTLTAAGMCLRQKKALTAPRSRRFPAALGLPVPRRGHLL